MRSELEQYPFVNVFKVPSFDVERNSPEGQCLLAGDEGNAVSLANGTAMLLQDRPQFADEVTRLACCDGLFAAASRSGVAVWHVNNALLAGCEAREGASFCAVALHRKLGVILGDSTGCLSVLGADGTPTLKERARWRLSESPLVSLTWCFGSELLALDEAMNIYYIDLLHPTEATVVFEASDNIPRGQSAFSDGSSIESACSARHLVLLHSVTNHQLTLIRRTQATPTPTPSVPAFSAIACLQLDTPPLSAHLTPCGDCIAYLATSTLILFDYESQTERALQLHSPFTSFSLSPDNVYALLWGGTSEARLSLYDLQYATFQEISGHTLPVQSCTFTPSGEHLFSVASSEHHFELFDWKVKQLAE
ncbi:hypothetical protein DIPPA_23047 [Diplonema papillatum]|nr:hypothetical protein DIPPA_23047 [Diplonema papillatum]